MKIDSHQHFWKYDAVEYAWISQEQTVLQHDFLPSDLDPLLEENGIDGSIAVQARQTAEETRWLLELSETHPNVKGVVGWVPLCSSDLNAILDQVGANPKLVGVRHVIHDEKDDDFILREDFNRGIRQLETRDLVYDILVFEKHIPQTIKFVDQHPNIQFVVDHIAKPRISSGALDQNWQKNILALSKRENVACKLSGMVTEVVDAEWDEILLAPYFDTVLNAFGSARLLSGSDWPVCLLRSTYARWWQTVHSAIRSLSEHEQLDILGKTACRIYKLP